AEASARKDEAAAEKDASHSVGKLGPLNVSPSGGVSTDDPNRSEGRWSFLRCYFTMSLTLSHRVMESNHGFC
ncbi:MAG: hypothetical protein Q9198_007830, partial [Flavoplaca austrocitrina]